MDRRGLRKTSWTGKAGAGLQTGRPRPGEKEQALLLVLFRRADLQFYFGDHLVAELDVDSLDPFFHGISIAFQVGRAVDVYLQTSHFKGLDVGVGDHFFADDVAPYSRNSASIGQKIEKTMFEGMVHERVQTSRPTVESFFVSAHRLFLLDGDGGTSVFF